MPVASKADAQRLRITLRGAVQGVGASGSARLSIVLEALLSCDHCVVQGFLAAGHACTVMGFEEYFPLAKKYQVPIVVTGFEPLEILEGIHMTVAQLEKGRHEVENQYTRAVRREGNRPAQQTITEAFEIAPRQWRGLGEIPASGFQLRGRFQKYDANRRFPFSGVREGLEFESPILSDCANVWPAVEALLKVGIEIHCRRDLTRGGLATTLKEIASDRNVCIKLEESLIPVNEVVQGACENLGLEPL